MWTLLPAVTYLHQCIKYHKFGSNFTVMLNDLITLNNDCRCVYTYFLSNRLNYHCYFYLRLRIECGTSKNDCNLVSTHAQGQCLPQHVVKCCYSCMWEIRRCWRRSVYTYLLAPRPDVNIDHVLWVPFYIYGSLRLRFILLFSWKYVNKEEKRHLIVLSELYLFDTWLFLRFIFGKLNWILH